MVLDPFFGTGTVGLIAQQLGRDWLGIELNPDFAGLAADRLGVHLGPDPDGGVGRWSHDDNP